MYLLLHTIYECAFNTSYNIHVYFYYFIQYTIVQYFIQYTSVYLLLHTIYKSILITLNVYKSVKEQLSQE